MRFQTISNVNVTMNENGENMVSQKLIAVQMDPLDHIDIKGDSTFALMLEAQARGHALFVYHVDSLTLSIQEGVQGSAQRAYTHLTAMVQPVTVRRDAEKYAIFGESVVRSLGEMDVILMRQDPPFDMAYIAATHLLEQVDGIGTHKAFVVNNPRWVRESPEKLFVMNFPDLMPPTIVTRDINQIYAFREQWRDIIIKPLFYSGGKGVFRIREQDQNLNALLEMYFSQSREPLMIQRYEPAVVRGDKRIILVDGKPIGAINRVPSKTDHRSNMHVGGVAHPVILTERDKHICQAIGSFLRDHNLIFVGIDVIGDYLTEINVTSPTGLQELERLSGINGTGLIWDCIERKLNA